MDGRSGMMTIGKLAERTGTSVRTLRFWSDAGVLPSSGRTDVGYRLYDVEALGRANLIRTLRELGLGLTTVRAVLARQASLAAVAEAHARALDAQIDSLRLQRTVLRAIVMRGSALEEAALMHRLSKLSARERQRLVDEFVTATFQGVDPGSPGAAIAAAMRQMPAALPDEPTVEQVNAWIELAELMQDKDFSLRIRRMAELGAIGGRPEAVSVDPQLVIQYAGPALADGIDPASAEGRKVLDLIIGPATPSAVRVDLRERLEAFTDRRVERYWQLLGVINGRPPFEPMTPTFEWVIAALRASEQ